MRIIEQVAKALTPRTRLVWCTGRQIYVSAVLVHDDGQVDVDGPDLSLVMWNHDPARLQSALGYRARVVWKPRYHVLNVSGYVFSMAALAERTPCVEKVAPPAELHTTVDRLLWEARTYGGYTVSMSSLRPGDEAKLAEELNRDGEQFRGGHRGALRSAPAPRRGDRRGQ